MRIVETYSHLNGLEFLLVHRKGLWHEIQTVIGAEPVNKSTARPDLAPALLAVRLCTGPLLGATSGRSRRFLHRLSVDAEKCRTKVSKEKTRHGKLLYGPIDMNAAFKRLLREKSWSESRVSYWVTRGERLVRKTLALPAAEQKREIEAAGETPIFSYNQTDFVKNRVAVEVQFGKYAFVAYDLFVKHLAFYVGDRIDVGVEILPMKSLQSRMSSGVAYFEGEFYNVVRQGRGVPAVPLVLLGIEP